MAPPPPKVPEASLEQEWGKKIRLLSPLICFVFRFPAVVPLDLKSLRKMHTKSRISLPFMMVSTFLFAFISLFLFLCPCLSLVLICVETSKFSLLCSMIFTDFLRSELSSEPTRKELGISVIASFLFFHTILCRQRNSSFMLAVFLDIYILPL